jgi:hypothetical protein
MLDRELTVRHALWAVVAWVALKAYVAYALVFKMSEFLSQAVRG